MSTPYAGNPGNFPVAITIPVDGVDTPTFANIEGPVEGNKDAISVLALGPALNWRSSFTNTTLLGNAGYYIFGGAYDPLLDRWLLAGATGSGPTVQSLFSGLGGDDANTAYWLNAGSPHSGVSAAAVAADPVISGRYWNAAVIGTADLYIDYTAYTGGGFTNGFSITGATTLLSVAMATFNGRIIAAVGTETNDASNLLLSAPSSAPTSWGTQNTGEVVSAWRLATDSATILIAVPYDQPTSTGITNYWYTTDGHTWTSVTLSSTLLLSSSDICVGICWSPVQKAFFAFVDQSGTPQVFKSANGITWAEVAMVTTSTIVPADMAAVGPNLVASLQDGGGTTGSRFIFSPDGGATWYNTQASFDANISNVTTGYIPPRLVQGDSSLFAINNLRGRFSHLLGLPSVRL